MTTDNQPEQPRRSKLSMDDRKQIFLEELERTGIAQGARRKAGVTPGMVHMWLDEDLGFGKALNEVNSRARERIAEDIRKRIRAGEKVSNAERRRVFLAEFAAVGAMTPAVDAAGLSLRTIAEWLQDKPGFREDLHEAKLRFRDRLEMEAVEQIIEEKDPVLLRFKLRAEIPEKYGRARSAKARQGLTMDDLERMAQKARESNDGPTM